MSSDIGNTSPSSPRSLFKNLLDILQQRNAKIWDKTTQAEVWCLNCNVLSEMIRELEQKLEILSE